MILEEKRFNIQVFASKQRKNKPEMKEKGL